MIMSAKENKGNYEPNTFIKNVKWNTDAKNNLFYWKQLLVFHQHQTSLPLIYSFYLNDNMYITLTQKKGFWKTYITHTAFSYQISLIKSYVQSYVRTTYKQVNTFLLLSGSDVQIVFLYSYRLIQLSSYWQVTAYLQLRHTSSSWYKPRIIS